MKEKKKIRVRQERPLQGAFGGKVRVETRVIEVSEDATVDGKVVPNDTPVHDWQLVENK